MSSQPLQPKLPQPTAASLAALSALYLSQGLPSGLFAHALPVFWREAGVALYWIGTLKLLALPWVLKALWAPAIDRSLQQGTPPIRWIGGLQLMATLTLGLLALLGLAPAGPQLLLVVLLILVINLLMATQDVVTDGLAVKWIPAHWRGFANTIQVAGYKIGMLIGGALLLVLARHLGNGFAMLVPASLLLVTFLLLYRYPPLRRSSTSEETTPPALWAGFTGFIAIPGMLPWLVILATYKIADAMGSGMIRPMLTDQGWDSSATGTFTLVTTGAGLIGAIIGGGLYQRAGSRRSLIWLGLAQAVTIAAWALVAEGKATTGMVYAIGMLEQLADGASTVALFAVMMSLCRKAWEGTDFTLQASLQVMSSGLFGAVGGLIAHTAGYAFLLLLSGGLGILVIVAMAIKTRHALQPLSNDRK